MDAHFLEYRKVGRRLALTGLLELTAPCHLGGAAADATSDRPLLRDAEGRPYLPGTTLTGLLRSLLERTDLDAANQLFGAVWDDSEGNQARLLLSDARIEQEGPVPTELRDGVAIDPKCGVAADKKKYDLELLPVGVRFRLRGQLELYGKPERDKLLLNGLLVLLLALEAGQLALGARTRRGFGETRLVADEQGRYWQVEDYTLATPAGLYAWLGRGLNGLPMDWPQVTPVVFRDAAALAEQWGVDLPKREKADGFAITVRLVISGSLLIGSEGHHPEQPDRSHLQRLCWQGDASRLESVLPATSLGGVLRHRCLRVAQTLASQASNSDKAVKLIDDMFGPVNIRSKAGRSWASRVTIQEAPVQNGQFLRHMRVRIDPWTGGAVESLLFTEDALYGGQVSFILRLQTSNKDDWAAPARALLLLALRDLANGDLNVGAEGSVGRGRLRPLPDQPFAMVATPSVKAKLYLQADGTVRCEPEDAFTDDFAGLHRYFGGGESA